MCGCKWLYTCKLIIGFIVFKLYIYKQVTFEMMSIIHYFDFQFFSSLFLLSLLWYQSLGFERVSWFFPFLSSSWFRGCFYGYSRLNFNKKQQWSSCVFIYPGFRRSFDKSFISYQTRTFQLFTLEGTIVECYLSLLLQCIFQVRLPFLLSMLDLWFNY